MSGRLCADDARDGVGTGPPVYSEQRMDGGDGLSYWALEYPERRAFFATTPAIKRQIYLSVLKDKIKWFKLIQELFSFPDWHLVSISTRFLIFR